MNLSKNLITLKQIDPYGTGRLGVAIVTTRRAAMTEAGNEYIHQKYTHICQNAAVKEISTEEAIVLAGLDEEGSKPQLSDPLQQSMLEELQAAPARHFLIAWDGYHYPHGIMVAGWTITGTQHGRVSFREGGASGYYKRLSTDGPREYRMLIHLHAPPGDRKIPERPAPRAELRGTVPTPGLEVMSMSELFSLQLDGSQCIKLHDPSQERGQEWALAHLGLVTPNAFVDEEEGVSYTRLLEYADRISTAGYMLKQYDFDRGLRVWFVTEEERAETLSKLAQTGYELKHFTPRPGEGGRPYWRLVYTK